MIRIIGIGSPVVGDEIGMQLVEQLRSDVVWQQREEIEWLVLERPGASLLQYFAGVDIVCVIDALESSSHKGVVRLALDEILGEERTFSSHQFGVAESLQLARVLNQLPHRLLLYGIAGGQVSQNHDELSAMLRHDLPASG